MKYLYVQANGKLGQLSLLMDLPEKKNLVEDVEYLLPVNLRQNLFSIYRGEIVNLSQRQRSPSVLMCRHAL